MGLLLGRYGSLRWIWQQPELVRRVAVVGHGGAFSFLMHQHGHVEADEAMLPRFGNYELRGCEVVASRDKCQAATPDASPGGAESCDSGVLEDSNDLPHFRLHRVPLEKTLQQFAVL